MRGTLVERTYELMVITAPELSEEDLGFALAQVITDIETSGGVIERVSTESPWGRRRLSYPIRHMGRDVREGFYALHYFTMMPEKLNEFERDMRLNERLMRHLTLVIDAVPELPPEPEEPVTETAAAENVVVVVDPKDHEVLVVEIEKASEIAELPVLLDVEDEQPSEDVTEVNLIDAVAEIDLIEAVADIADSDQTDEIKVIEEIETEVAEAISEDKEI